MRVSRLFGVLVLGGVMISLAPGIVIPSDSLSLTGDQVFR